MPHYLLVWALAGGLVAWLASFTMKTDLQRSVFRNMVMGIVGTAIGSWIVAPLIDIPIIDYDSISNASIAVALIGAVMLFASSAVDQFRHGSDATGQAHAYQ